jgi:hypothetical protein
MLWNSTFSGGTTPAERENPQIFMEKAGLLPP